MRPDPRKYLWDALQAAERLDTFRKGKSFADYQSDDLLKSAVERQFEIVGEALNQLSKADPELATKIPDLPRIVAFRRCPYAWNTSALETFATTIPLTPITSPGKLPIGRLERVGMSGTASNKPGEDTGATG